MWRVYLCLLLFSGSCVWKNEPVLLFPADEKEGIVPPFMPANRAQPNRFSEKSLQLPDTHVISINSTTPAPIPRPVNVLKNYVPLLKDFPYAENGRLEYSVAATEKFIPAGSRHVFAGTPLKIKARHQISCAGLERNIINMSQDEGLPGTQVFTLLQDRSGRLWIGTDNGLALYDGTWVYVYTVKEGLSGNKVSSLAEDNDGRIWIGTANSLCVFDGKTFLRFSGAEELFGSSAVFGNSGVQVLKCRDGKIWIGTPLGLSAYCPPAANDRKGEGFANINPYSASGSYNVQSLFEDRAGRIWTGTPKRLLVYDPKKITAKGKKKFAEFPSAPALRDGCIRSFAEDLQGRIWIGTCDAGAWIYHPAPSGKNGEAGLYHFTMLDGLSGNSVQSFFSDAEGNTWIGTDRGISIFDGKGFSSLSKEQGVAGNVRSLLMLKGDTRHIFIGTELDGLQQIRLTGFTHFFPEDPAIPSCFLEDRSGRIWAGTHRGGIYILDPGQKDKSLPKKIVRFNTDDLNISPASTITGLLEDRNGNIWIGTSRQEIIIYDGKTFSSFTLPSDAGAVPEENANVIFYHDQNKGRIVIGSYSGLYLYEGNYGSGTGEKKFIHYTTSSGLSSNNIVALTSDAAGKIWIGTRAGGVSVLDLQKNSGERFSHYNYENGLPDNHIFSMLTDLQGRIWIGAEAGLSMFNGKGFTVFSTTEGLTDNLVTALVCDSSDQIWAGTPRGLSVISENQDSTFSIAVFRKEEGLCRFDFNPNAALPARNNQFWWGTGTIITSYHPPLLKNRSAAEAILTHVDVGGKESQWFTPSGLFHEKILREDTLWKPASSNYFLRSSSPSDTGWIHRAGVSWTGVSGFYNLPKNLVLPYHQNHLTFHFTATCLTGSGGLRYRYLLDGLENSWNPAAENNEADYRNIPPGNYRFMVHARDGQGNWGRTAEFSFEVLPPWWKTGWAYSGYAGLAFSLVLLFTRLRTRKLQRDKKQLGEMVSERSARIIKQTEEIIRQKEQMRLKRNLHDGLGGVIAALRLNFSILDPGKPAGKAKEEAYQTGKKLLDEAYASVKDLSMDDLLEDRLNKHFVNTLSELLARARNNFGFETKLSAEIQEEMIDPVMKVNLYMIFKEAINNIITHSKGKKIIIHLSAENEQLQVTILDDGTGFDTAPAFSKGNGLRNMKSRVTEMNGKFTVISHEGEGTAFKIELPLKKPL